MDGSQFCVERNFEIVAALINYPNLDIIILSLYRVPDGDRNVFLEKMLIIYLSKKNFPIFICGDINIDIHLVEPFPLQFLDVLRSVDCYCTNNKPKRGPPWMDNEIINYPDNF